MLNRYPGVGGSKSSVNPGTRKNTISGGQKNVFGRLLGVDIILGGGGGGWGGGGGGGVKNTPRKTRKFVKFALYAHCEKGLL